MQPVGCCSLLIASGQSTVFTVVVTGRKGCRGWTAVGTLLLRLNATDACLHAIAACLLLLQHM